MKIKNSRRPTGREPKPGKPNGREKPSERVNSDGQDKSDEPGKPNDRDKQISPGKPGRKTIRKKDKEKEGWERAKGEKALETIPQTGKPVAGKQEPDEEVRGSKRRFADGRKVRDSR